VSEVQRQQETWALARSLGLTFVERVACHYPLHWAEHNGKLYPHLHYDKTMDQIKREDFEHPVCDVWRSGFGYTSNLAWGSLHGHEVYVFDYHDCAEYDFPWSKSRTQLVERGASDFSVIAIRLSKPLPRLDVFPEGRWEKVAKRTGGIDIDFESVEFSDQFRVWAKDKRFAYAICHSTMMDALMKMPDTAVRIRGDVFAVRSPALMPTDRLEKRIDDVVALAAQIPDFVYEGHKR